LIELKQKERTYKKEESKMDRELIHFESVKKTRMNAILKDLVTSQMVFYARGLELFSEAYVALCNYRCCTKNIPPSLVFFTRRVLSLMPQWLSYAKIFTTTMNNRALLRSIYGSLQLLLLPTAHDYQHAIMFTHQVSSFMPQWLSCATMSDIRIYAIITIG
jgi:hypothetical protein